MRFMREIGFWLSLGVTFALSAQSWADGPTSVDSSALKDNSSGGIVSRLFPDDDKGPPWRMKAKRQKDRMENATAKKPARSKSDANKAEVKKVEDATPKEPSPREKELAEVRQAQAAYLRRLADCDQLRDIALKTNDENLNRQADEIQAQAWSIYTKRVASHSSELASGMAEQKDLGAKEE
jgi:hypothetical protein